MFEYLYLNQENITIMRKKMPYNFAGGENEKYI